MRRAPKKAIGFDKGLLGEKGGFGSSPVCAGCGVDLATLIFPQ
jgi:hypothetical protein